MVDYQGKIKQGDLLLIGTCARCGGKVVRLVESD